MFWRTDRRKALTSAQKNSDCVDRKHDSQSQFWHCHVLPFAYAPGTIHNCTLPTKWPKRRWPLLVLAWLIGRFRVTTSNPYPRYDGQLISWQRRSVGTTPSAADDDTCNAAGPPSTDVAPSTRSIINIVNFFTTPAVAVPPFYLSSSADLGFTAILLLSSFFRQQPNELTERNATRASHMFESECSLKMHVLNFGTSPYCRHESARWMGM